MADMAKTAPGAAPVSAAPPADETDYEVQLESLNQWQLAWRRFKRHRLAVIGSLMFLIICAIGIFGPIFVPYDYHQIVRPNVLVPSGRAPSWITGQWNPLLFMGETSNLQRDVFVLVINGTRLSLAIGIGSTIISVVLGALAGGVAGYFGGWVDWLLMRIVDALLSLPLLFVILVASAFLGAGNWVTVMLIFCFLGWLGLARLVRSLFLSLREQDFVYAARAVGVSDMRIILRHILPNTLSPIIVFSSLSIAGVIIGEAFVSFLGFGVSANTPTWGNVLTGSLSALTIGNWWWSFFPGFAIVLTVLSINFMGDGLRDALDPRARV
jgi:peptide/nickel transport system permease protein